MTITAATFQSSYASLPERFHASVAASPVAAPTLIALNRDLAAELQLDPEWLASSEGIGVLAGNAAPVGSRPVALAYAGHQFGQFVPQLGDGRALLIGELTGVDGVQYDLQLKGSGPTPFARGGDGRAAMGPVLREYLVSEAMHALGIPTTRSLAAVATGEAVIRERRLPGAVLCRVARAHVRIGTFEYFAARRDTEALTVLADYVIQRLYPDLAASEQPYLDLLQRVCERQAELIAKWLSVGFVHGVMNTDNASIAGETIDYGPCAFMEAYDPETVFSSIDHYGRYAFGNQPAIAQWNLARLAEALLAINGDDADAASDRLDAFGARFESAWAEVIRAKLGFSQEKGDERELFNDLLRLVRAARLDWTLSFRLLADALTDTEVRKRLRQRFIDPEAFDAWFERWRQRGAAEPQPAEVRADAMRRTNPAFIPRNLKVEAALEAAMNENDFAPFERLLVTLRRPFDDQPDAVDLAEPAASDAGPYVTFCGT